MDFIKQEPVFDLDPQAQLEFLNPKTVIVIEKEKFFECKKLLLENAPDAEYASILGVPEDKIRFFKYKMQLFEDSMRAERRSAKLVKRRKKEAKGKTCKTAKRRDVTSEERFRKARELISRNLSTNQISKILKVSERSVTRFKHRMRQEERRLFAEGKIDEDPGDPVDESSFRNMKPDEKIKIMEDLFRKQIGLQEIADTLKISERSVRRWKVKLGKLEDEDSDDLAEGKIDKDPVDPVDENSFRNMKPDEKIRLAKNLFRQRLGVQEIADILKISERSVQRWKAKLGKLEDDDSDDLAEGKIDKDPVDPVDENSFRNMQPDEKIRLAKNLFRQRLGVQEIADILKISERSVQRWKVKLGKLKDEGGVATEADLLAEYPVKQEDTDEPVLRPTRVRAKRPPVLKVEPNSDEEEPEEAEIEDEDWKEDAEDQPARKRRRLYFDKERIQYARELIDNDVSIKEMSLLLEMSAASVRRLKMKILDETEDDTIDDNEEHKKTTKSSAATADDAEIDEDGDPLHLLDEVVYPKPTPSTSKSFKIERKTKAVLGERDMFKAALLREKSVRTMDIAKMMKVSERSVTRMLAKARDSGVAEYDADIVADVEQMIAEKDKLLNADVIDEEQIPVAEAQAPAESKRQLGVSLIALKVKLKDIAQMLDVSEKTVQRWKAKMNRGGDAVSTSPGDDDMGHPVFSNLLIPKEEKVDDDERLLEYE